MEAPLIIIATSLPALRLLRPTKSVPLRIRIRHPIHPQRRPSSSSLTPLDPYSPYPGVRVPPRPLRPVSSRSFMTSSTRTENNNTSYVNIKGQQRGLTPMSNSSDNLVKGLDYNFNHWNPAIPPTTTTPTTPHAPGGPYPQQQQQQQQSHTPALSTSSTLYNTPSSPEAQANNIRGPVANPSYSNSNIGSANTNTADNTAYTWHATNPNTAYNTNNSSNGNGNNNTPYNWHATNPYPPYQFSTDHNRRLTPLEEEQSRTTSHAGIPSWTSEFESEVGVGLGRNPSTLHRNVSTRRESPTLGIGSSWNNRNRDPMASRNTRETDLMEREQEFEYDIPRAGGKSYFARLQALSGLSGYTIGNPFTSRI